MTAKTCSTCRFAKADGDRLHCARNPPQLVIVHEGTASYAYPLVGVHMTACGEYRTDWRKWIKGKTHAGAR